MEVLAWCGDPDEARVERVCGSVETFGRCEGDTDSLRLAGPQGKLGRDDGDLCWSVNKGNRAQRSEDGILYCGILVLAITSNPMEDTHRLNCQGGSSGDMGKLVRLSPLAIVCDNECLTVNERICQSKCG